MKFSESPVTPHQKSYTDVARTNPGVRDTVPVYMGKSYRDIAKEMPVIRQGMYAAITDSIIGSS